METMEKSSTRRNKTVTVSLTESQRRRLEEIAADMDRSLSWTVGHLIDARSQDQSRTFRVVTKSD